MRIQFDGSAAMIFTLPEAVGREASSWTGFDSLVINWAFPVDRDDRGRLIDDPVDAAFWGRAAFEASDILLVSETWAYGLAGERWEFRSPSSLVVDPLRSNRGRW